jgi:uncharacterized YigZ family protein
MTPPYQIPAHRHRVELHVSNSRFIATTAPAPSVEVAKRVIAEVRTEMPDASHHVYAFRVGYGNTVIEGMSDDGEPSGTAGPPVLAVLRGAEIGDIVLIVTRYFGGTKLGTGGLVRAYSEAARMVLENLATETKIKRAFLGIEIPYSLYEQLKRLILKYDGRIDDEHFAAAISIIALFPEDQIPEFSDALRDLSAGRIEAIPLSQD